MRRRFLFFLIMLVAQAAACSDSTGPESFSISGTWRSVDFGDAQFSMTIVETARAVEGAGYRMSGGEASACHVIGAHTGREASLLLDFDDRADINFEGEFAREEGETALRGELYGGGYSGQEITFRRAEED
jgi:hypothetical protein